MIRILIVLLVVAVPVVAQQLHWLEPDPTDNYSARCFDGTLCGSFSASEATPLPDG